MIVIRHVVLFSAKHAADIPTIRQALRGLAAIPFASHLEVALNRRWDQVANETDLVVYAEFEDEDALAAFKAHPIYDATTAIVRPLRETRIAVDFTAEGR